MIVGTHDTAERVLIVAEVGNNHEGDIEVARELVRQAAAAGVDAVKFQTFVAERFVGVSNPDRLAQLKRFQLTFEQFEELAALARENGLLFVSTPFDMESLDLLVRVADAIKIASGDNDFYPLIRRAAASGRPLIVSAGVSDLDQVSRTVAEIEEVRSEDFGLLHAVSAYPTPPDEVNLRSIAILAERFGHTVGYSDHTLDNEACVLAVGVGARILEKHFTLEDVVSDFRDHALSATPSSMAELVRRVRSAEELLGVHGKHVGEAESALAEAIRRSIAAGAALPAGHVLREEDLIWVRPGSGLRPGQEGLLLGRPLARDVAFGDLLSQDDVS
jgi:sialic acid synthase SpsE